MSNTETKVLILGHSFVRRFKRDLNHYFDPRARRDFNLTGTASVCLHGVGGRTVDKLQRFDLNFVKETCPEILILEIGSNDLSYMRSLKLLDPRLMIWFYLFRAKLRASG